MQASDSSEAAQKFVEKWAGVELSERAASHEHFTDLCRLLGQPTPATADPTGADYCFEKNVKVTRPASKGSKGERGFVDVWKRGFFAWEYKEKDKYKSLDEAYRQLYQYRDDLDNPPLSIVCDIATTEIRTHFSGYPTEKIVLKLQEIPGRLEVLRRCFTSPDTFRPAKTRQEVTKDLAKEFSDLANKLIDRYPPGNLSLFQSPGSPVAHFLMKVMFCLFAEDIGLLPENAFTKVINRSLFTPESFAERAGQLFALMRTGGEFGNDVIPYFNGGLFDTAAPLPLLHGDVTALSKASARDWAGVEPSIFGTLFERILDPAKRAQIGAHYTGVEDILLVVEPVVMQPLWRKWQAVQDELSETLEKYGAETGRKKRDVYAGPIRVALDGFRRHLAAQRILDPACGSGNFLYVALQQLLDLDAEVVRFAGRHEIALDPTPYIRPRQLHGIEINPYAAELAQVVIWIGYLQWLSVRGIDAPHNPILDSLQSIENRDAILDLSDPKIPTPATWPDADFIIGNPPFLGGGKLMRRGLGGKYLAALASAYPSVPRSSDLCCYWFYRANDVLRSAVGLRVGLLATQGIRGGVNRRVLDQIASELQIFLAWSDREWINEGAAVHVSIVGFDNLKGEERTLDGQNVHAINSDLTSGIDLTKRRQLSENADVQHEGDKKGADFEVSSQQARTFLSQPNLSNHPVSQVFRPWVNGSDVNRRNRGYWIIDFGADKQEASEHADLFAYVLAQVAPKYEHTRETWWRHERSRPEMRQALSPLPRFLVTVRHAPFRNFAWMFHPTLPDSALVCLARSDDYFFGVLSASVHNLWARRVGTQVREKESGDRYTGECFETFPLPWPPGKEDTKHAAYRRISEAAKELNDRRERWLNPPEWLDPIAERIDASDDFADVPDDARPLIRQSAIMAAAAKDARLKKRTLTNLYNERPTWLKLAHETLDRAVLAAYTAVNPAGGWSEDWAAVWVDTGAGQPLPKGHPLEAERKRVDQLVLGNLLSMNQERAAQ